MDQGMGAPLQVEMGSGGLDKYFHHHDAVLVKQTMRGCLQECLGCEAKSEYNISKLDWSKLDGYKLDEDAMNKDNELYALENSGFCMRCCWRDGRGFNMEVKEWVSNDKATAGTGKGIVNYKKDCGMPLNCTFDTGEYGAYSVPCCCMLPRVDMTTPDGQTLGSYSQYICDQNLLVPKLMYGEGDTPVYIVKPETCCGGCCIACNCSGKGSIFLPFYFHDPNTGEPISSYGEDAPQIRKLWAGFKKECCSDADTFGVKFPPGSDTKRKAGILGMTFLIDFTVFEKQSQAG